MADTTTEQLILGKLREIARTQDEMSLRMRVDTPWLIAKDQLRHLLDLLRQVPMAARVCLLAGVLSLTYAAMYRSGKALAVGVDLVFVSFLFVGVEV